MTNKIPVDTLYHATIVTKDAKALAKNYAEIFGIDRWWVVRATSERLTNVTLRGLSPRPNPFPEQVGPVMPPNAFEFISAIGSSANGGLTFEILQPIGGLSTFEEFLVTRGQGVHSLFIAETKPSEFSNLQQFLTREGVPVAQSFTLDEAADFYFLDTRNVLGGFYIQVVVPRRPNWREAIKADENWDFSDQVSRPLAVSAVTKATGIRHFGVVVPDVIAYTRNFARLFGLPIWRGKHWRTEAGSLDNTICNGRPVVHAYFTGRGDVGKMGLDVSFGFEIVQPTFGPSHYKEDFLQILGPGIHHVDVSVPFEDWSQWEAFNTWLADLDAPTCMSGWLAGGLRLFHYQDTRNKLGFVTEFIAPLKAQVNLPRASQAPDYWYDFTEELAAAASPRISRPPSPAPSDGCSSHTSEPSPGASQGLDPNEDHFEPGS